MIEEKTVTETRELLQERLDAEVKYLKDLEERFGHTGMADSRLRAARELFRLIDKYIEIHEGDPLLYSAVDHGTKVVSEASYFNLIDIIESTHTMFTPSMMPLYIVAGYDIITDAMGGTVQASAISATARLLYDEQDGLGDPGVPAVVVGELIRARLDAVLAEIPAGDR